MSQRIRLEKLWVGAKASGIFMADLRPCPCKDAPE